MINNNFMRKSQVAILSILAVFIMCSTSWAATYYVDSSVGVSGDGSIENPWKNISNITGIIAGDNVLFRSGKSWSEQLTPTSGTSGNVVTYGAYGTGDKPSIRRIYADGKSYIKAENIEFTNNVSSTPVYILGASHHITFETCDIISGTSSTNYASLRIQDGSHHISVLTCSIEHRRTSGVQDGLYILHNVDYCLFQGNTFGDASHYSFASEGNSSTYPSYENNYNVIKDNTFNNTQDSALSLLSGSNFNLVEGNTIIAAGTEDSNIVSFKNVSSYNIIRNNIIRDNLSGTHGYTMGVYRYGDYPPNIAEHNHVYNNTIAGINNTYAFLLQIDDTLDSGAYCRNNYFKNNISYSNGSSYQLYIGNYPTNVYDNYFSNNLFYTSGVTNVINKGPSYSVAGIESANPTHFSNNRQVDPNLDYDYIPKANSPVIDAGDYLTKVTSESNSGSTFSVEDAGYFTDGFGIIQGDKIRVGNTTATIESIAYGDNTITVSENISWNYGDPVSLPYGGERPDIGFFETNLSDNLGPDAPQGLKIIRLP